MYETIYSTEKGFDPKSANGILAAGGAAIITADAKELLY
uniref:Uncharacterized protein n=1 Tax=uncultured Desulfobacterium sp. TaxID=201089 RepID=E1YHC4_9BACT|nr:unknown protein [uncultured Desulfobacterium sp.]